MNIQRTVMYGERMKVLKGEDVHQDVLNLIPDFVTEIITSNVNKGQDPSTWDIEKLNKALEDKALPRDSGFITEAIVNNWDYNYIVSKTIDEVINRYEKKIAAYAEEGIDYNEFERFIFLKVVDNKWIDHIDAMDRLKRGISLRGYANEDPVIAYKKEGLEMFEEMTASIQEEVVAILLKSEIKKVPQKEERKDLVENGGSKESSNEPIVKAKTVGRNDPCPCGSGLKFKNCCGRKS